VPNANDTNGMPGGLTAVPAGDSCRVLAWKVFKPGFHKGQYYSANECKRTVENFAKLSAGDDAYLKAKAKLGHDDEQRLANSIGMPSMGRITACRLTPDGGFEIDIEGVPVKIGEEINAGRINDGSVELNWDVPDPQDPTKFVDGPVLTAIAFLGEEKPGVKGLPSPKAVFSASTRRTARRIRMSEVDPMNRDELIAQLKAKGVDVAADPALANLPDDALAALLKAMPAAAPAAGPAVMSDDKDTDDMAKKYAELEKKNAEMAAKFAALEAGMDSLKKSEDEVKQAAKFAKDYRATVEDLKRQRAVKACEDACNSGRMLPAAKDQTVADLMKLSDDKAACFSEGANKGKTPFQAEIEAILARTPDARFSAAKVSSTEVESVSVERRKQLLKHAGEAGRVAIANLKN
jgi:hypothetical protein